MEINTTRPAGGGLTTTTMGPTALPTVAQNNPNNSASMVAIADYMKQKSAQQAPRAQMMPAVSQQPEYSPQSWGSAPSTNRIEAQKSPVTRMRRVQRRSSIPIYGMEGNGLTYDEVPETMLPDGSWSLDAVHGTLAGNEAAAMNGPNDITRLVGMNFSGLGGGTWGLTPAQEKARRG